MKSGRTGGSPTRPRTDDAINVGGGPAALAEGARAALAGKAALAGEAALAMNAAMLNEEVRH